MGSVPLTCRICGYVSTNNRGIHIAPGVTDVTISNAFGESCPNGHGPMQFLQGTMDGGKGLPVLKSGPAWSWDLLRSLDNALRYAQDNMHSRPDESMRRLTELSPEIAQLIAASQQANSAISTKDIIGYLLNIITILIAVYYGERTPPPAPPAPPTVINTVIEVHHEGGRPLTEDEVKGIVDSYLKRDEP